jgi:hypothetical protein
VHELVGGLRGISLEGLEERAALLRRVDTKYVLEEEAFARLVERLAEDHAALAIDGRREFAYRTVYFDTPALRSYREHLEGRRPRFKARTRLYADSGLCHFEVKIKTADDQTDKRQAKHPPDRVDRMDERARRLLRETLEGAGIDAPRDLDPTLRTDFRRLTLSADEGGARLTCDRDLHLTRMDGEAVRMRPGLVLVETKSEDGGSRADRLLAEAGVEPLSLSKYRVGVDLLVEADPSGDLRDLRALFGPTA